MSTFRTEFSTRLHKNSISHSAQILTIGSCFADSIGNRLAGNKFHALTNPFGTTYNPLSIHKLLQMACHNQVPSPETYLINEDIHSNYDFHSSLSALSRQELEKKLKEMIGGVHHFLSQCDFLFITYGTSWVYERKDTQETVANCHKQPSSLFTKSLLNQKAIEDSFKEMYADLKKLNPNIQIILTLSPVRHLKDTIELNSVSKSILRTACYTISESSEDVNYFPAYEIMMDDLRDYRFYTADMIHPSAEAEEYIWNKFSESHFSPETRNLLKEWQTVKKMIEHRPFHPSSASHQKFVKDLRAKLEALQPKLDVSQELSQYL
ncbi:MAG TPA: GSCFA domain-containing protein [Cyclobacteriaceae bacterium]